MAQVERANLVNRARQPLWHFLKRLKQVRESVDSGARLT